MWRTRLPFEFLASDNVHDIDNTDTGEVLHFFLQALYNIKVGQRRQILPEFYMTVSQNTVEGETL